MLVAMSRTKLTSFRSGNGGVRKTINVDLTSASGCGHGGLPDTKSRGGGGGGEVLPHSYTYVLQQIYTTHTGPVHEEVREPGLYSHEQTLSL